MAKLYNVEKTDEEIIAFLDGHFKENAENKKSRFYATLDMIPSGKKILDYGCGWGQLAVAMKNKGNVVHGIDYKNEIDISQLYWKDEENVTFSDQSISEIENAAYDIVVSCQVAEHVHNVGNYFKEVSRVLKVNGSLVISIPNIINPRYFLPHFNWKYEERLKQASAKMLVEYDKVNHHINSWDPRHFVTLMASLGFRLKEYQPSEGISFPQQRPFTWLGEGAYIRNWISRIPMFRNFSRTSHFTFIKENEVTISNSD